MREVLDRLEQLGLRWYITGAEALGRYGEPRMTADLDVVVDLDTAGFARALEGLEGAYLIKRPVDFDGHVMASLISVAEVGKVDLILGRQDAWSRSAMDRRERWEHPALGQVWVISLEDLIRAPVARLPQSGAHERDADELGLRRGLGGGRGAGRPPRAGPACALTPGARGWTRGWRR